MKFFVVFAALLAVSLALPAGQVAEILRYDNENNGIDSYNFAFDTSDGISRTEEGQLKNIGTENEALVVRGSYQYVGPDGITYKVTFIADENGFQPQGAHLPVGPV